MLHFPFAAFGGPTAILSVADQLSAHEICRSLETRCDSPAPVEACKRSLIASPHFFQFFRRPQFFSFSPSSTRRPIRFVCDALQSFSMEASVCLPCDVSQKWSGLEPWQWRRRCSRSGRALGVLCLVRASKAVVASPSFPLHLLEGINR